MMGNRVVHDFGLLVIVVGLGLLRVVIVLRLAETEHLAHDDVVVDDILRLRAGHGVQRVRVLGVSEKEEAHSLSSHTQVIRDNIEA